MQSKPEEMHLYEYAVIRYLPRVEREEFINVGLVMMCKRRRWVKVEISLDPERLRAFHRGADVEAISFQLEGFRRVASGGSKFGPIASLDAHERFRWLTAVRSSVIQTSRPHPGHCPDLEKEFDRLFGELVAPHEG